MGLLDSIVSAVGGQSPQAAEQAALLPALIEQVQAYPGGLPGLIERFQQGGLGDVIASWVSTQGNDPVTPEQLRPVLGEDLIGKLAQGSGQNADSVLGNLSVMLPSLVDQLTPNGQAGQDMGGSVLGSLAGMLGKR
ncbi:MAG: YidB family protein [Burkholderiaceae bacterium]